MHNDEIEENFMDGIIFFSSLAGILYTIPWIFIYRIMGLEKSFAWALLTGVVFTMLLYIVISISKRYRDKKYAEFEKNIQSPILCQTDANFAIGNGKVRNGKAYFCQAGIACVCILNKKNAAVDQIPTDNMDRIEYDNVNIHVYTKDEKHYIIITPEVPSIIQELRKAGWNVKAL